MAKRHATEALEELLAVDSPLPKRIRSETSSIRGNIDAPIASAAPPNGNGMQLDGGSLEDEAAEEADEEKAPLRQSAPTEGYDDLYLDTIDRNVLDFDFEKLCSVSLSNINVYAFLVCGRYYQGRGPKSHAYFHALDDDHHVFINMKTQRVYVLPEG